MMRWRRIPRDEEPESLLFFGLRLHGHLGPFMVAGLRMGSLALRLLDHPGYHGIEAEVETGTRPPLSCLIDGIQISTGCTLGKGNLSVQDKSLPRATFRTEAKDIHIALKEKWLEEFLSCLDLETLSRRILYLPVEELFEWELSPSS